MKLSTRHRETRSAVRVILAAATAVFLALCLIGLLLTRCAARPSRRAPAPGYRGYAGAAAEELEEWYNQRNGQFRTTGWWNSANDLEALIDAFRLNHTGACLQELSNTFEKHRDTHFLNDYYDDEGWWALLWIKAFDLTGDHRYLEMARTIFNDMKGGWDDHCGGGLWWRKDRKYKNAIPNELFLTVAARLHLRTPGDRGPGSDLDWAEREWSWFSKSGMLNSRHLINDGLTTGCENNHGAAWTYNQGVILGGLADLYQSTHRKALLTTARSTADAAIQRLVDEHGILQEPCEKNSDCGGDGSQFKGIFVRNLAYLNRTTHSRVYREFLRRQADCIWKNDRNGDDQFGLRWMGPFDRADASRQGSALDAFNAAAG